MSNKMALDALKFAEAALADIGDADREPGDDLAWCEARAAEALPRTRAAIAALQAEPQPEQTASISLGPVAFEFAHFQQWVNKASTWFGALHEANSNAAQRRYLCIDAAGRVCMIGRDFSRARDEGKFPVRVHLIDALPATTPKD